MYKGRFLVSLAGALLLAGCGASAIDLSYLATPQGPQSQFGDSKPVSFKGGSPHGLEIHGIDVARYQGDIDWRTVKANGVSFAFIKATEGGDVFDVAFNDNWWGARRAGLPRGAYHFYYFCRTAAEQADWFIANVPRDEAALPPVLDIEWNAHSTTCSERPDREHIVSEMRIFMDRLEAHYGKRPIIYTAPDFYEDNLRRAFPNHTFWLRSVTAHPRVKYGSRSWGFWQYTGTGRVTGIDGDVDINAFNGDAEDWQAWLAENGAGV